jgi:hypothetical protein
MCLVEGTPSRVLSSPRTPRIGLELQPEPDLSSIYSFFAVGLRSAAHARNFCLNGNVNVNVKLSIFKPTNKNGLPEKLNAI